MRNAEFEPLFRAIAKLGLATGEREALTNNYLFMYLDNGLFAYKHVLTRHYVYLDEMGVIQAGVLSSGSYDSALGDTSA